MRTRQFFREFLKSPKTVGAVAPSSKGLARMMLQGVDFDKVGALAEFGAGTGAFTQEITSQLRPDAQFFTFEINRSLCDILKGRYPGINVVEESVLNLPDLLRQNSIEKLDCIISGLPFAVFNKEDQHAILQVSSDALGPGGTFRTFAYLQGTILPAGIRFRRLLEEHFSSVRKTPVVWANLPPAFVYICQK